MQAKILQVYTERTGKNAAPLFRIDSQLNECFHRSEYLIFRRNQITKHFTFFVRKNNFVIKNKHK